MRSSPIRTRLQSGFAAPPLLLEIAEAVAAHNSSAYFPFILKLAENNSMFGESDSAAYEQAFEWIRQESLLQPFAQYLARLELTVHAHAPAVVAQYQLYNSTVVPELKEARGHESFDNSCAIWAQYKDKQACSVDALNKLLDIEKFYGTTYIEEAKAEPVQLDMDHVYPTKGAAAPKIVALYADPRASGFVDMHEHLKQLAENSEITYIFRYRPWNTGPESESESERLHDAPLGLAGYGVELALKSTEYKVIDDRDLDDDGSKVDSNPKLALGGVYGGQEITIFKDEKEPAIKGLSEKLVADIDIKAAQVVLKTSYSRKLAVLKQLAQDLPRYAHLIAEVPINKTLASKLESDLSSSYEPRIFVNGLELDEKEMDPFNMLIHIGKEDSIISSLESLGIPQSQAVDLLFAADKFADSSDSSRLVFDMRDRSDSRKTILWLNDLEKDQRYLSWPSDIQIMKRIISPGMIQRLRKNVVQVIFALDLSQPDSWVLVFEELMANIEHGLPIQFGVVPLIDYNTPDHQSAANIMAKYLAYLRRSFKRKDWHSIVKGSLVSFYQARTSANSAKPFVKHAQSVYEAYAKTHNTRSDEKPFRWDQIASTASTTTEDADTAWLSKRWNDIVGYCARLDLSTKSSPDGLVFVNGEQYAMGRNYQQSVFNAYQMQAWELAQKVRANKLTSNDNIQDFVYGSDTAMPLRNSLIFVSEEYPLRTLSLDKPSAMSWVDNTVKYVKPDLSEDADETAQSVSTWIVGNFASKSVRQIAAEALEAAKIDSSIRVAFIHATRPVSVADVGRPEDEDEESYDQSDDDNKNEGYDVDAPQVLYQLVNSDIDSEIVSQYLRGADNVSSELSNKHNKSSLLEPLNEFIDDAEMTFAANQDILVALGAIPSERDSCYVVVNGRIIPEISATTSFTKDSFTMLAAYEAKERIGAVRKAIAQVIPSEQQASSLPNFLLKVSSIISHARTLFASNGILQRQKRRSRQSLEDLMEGHPVAPLSFNTPSQVRIRIQAVLDPLSEATQRLAPILETLISGPEISLELWLNPQPKLKELPVKRFYRYLWPESLKFDDSGKLADPEIVFNGIPADPLLTLGMDVPSAWLVSAIESVHDLDNIRLSSLKDQSTGISAIYKLVNILVEGHLVDTNSRSPARGLEVQLGTFSNPAMTDTIVMANLGYLQLKANPGVWAFSIRPGRSKDIYRLDNIGTGRWDYAAAAKQIDAGKEDYRPVVVNSFSGNTVFPLVSKRAGRENDDVLEDTGPAGAASSSSGSSDKGKGSSGSSSSSGGGLWGKIRGTFGKSDSNSKASADLAVSKDGRPHFDVFAVASGHLYERLMSIMITSVLNNTQSHVKFWLIENFLSPSFKAFVPHMAEEFGFDFEFVTYKWPHWLNHETEKQRTIWGYKILFLDVLFPLNLDRVIFVDADQIVRADLQELADMDLKGAPYGYVPFCDDREEIDGYRFWKNGWWKDHLRGKPYHISALYVVDLKRFRQLAAGDRLRGQYQMLSQDSNSLANLDQDLPNNMQHMVPIFSLPQEWLWCETWCSDESLKKAKTIDLCNNPMTKEPKLERARRLLPEWEVYDKKVSDFSKKLAQRGKLEGSQIADAQAVAIEQPPVAASMGDTDETSNAHDEL
ncbi:killer toxin resistant protein [Coemansia asiatica]|uniref:Killer toxin resistant protein n=1 Tax=Coemansia asiatica TaxID=1052880 RepID=A0A9W7XPF6_9FUNG|nr:killer toxin resistant protein [Coemansia asiatica]